MVDRTRLAQGWRINSSLGNTYDIKTDVRGIINVPSKLVMHLTVGVDGGGKSSLSDRSITRCTEAHHYCHTLTQCCISGRLLQYLSSWRSRAGQ